MDHTGYYVDLVLMSFTHSLFFKFECVVADNHMNILDKLIVLTADFRRYWDSSHIMIWHRSRTVSSETLCEYCRKIKTVRMCDHNSTIDSIVCFNCYITYV